MISGLAARIAGVRHQITRFKIIRSVQHQIITADQRHRVAGIEPRNMGFEPDIRIKRVDLLGGAIGLPAADIRAWCG